MDDAIGGMSFMLVIIGITEFKFGVLEKGLWMIFWGTLLMLIGLIFTKYKDAKEVVSE